MEIIYEDKKRAKFLQTPEAEKVLSFYDPQCDNPVSDYLEEEIRERGPYEFLNKLLIHTNVDLIPYPKNEYQAVRAIRKVLRQLPEFTGERYKQ